MRIASAAALARLLTERLAESGEPGRAVTVAELVDRVLPYPLVRERLGLAGKAEYDLALLGLLSDRILLQLDPALHEAATKELDQPEPDLRPLEKLSESLLRVRDPAGAGRAPDPNIDETDAEGEGDAGPEPAVAAGPEPAVAAGPERDLEPVVASTTGPASAPEPRSTAEPEPEPGLAADAEPEPTPESRSAPATDAEPEPTPESRPAPVADAQPEPTPGREPVVGIPAAVACRSCATPLPVREGVRFCPHCGVDQHRARCVSCGDRLEPGWSFCPRCGRPLGGP